MAGYEIEVIIASISDVAASSLNAPTTDLEAVDSWMALLPAAAEATLAHEAVPLPAGLTLLLTNDEHLHELNRAFRGEDKPTDVLSFAYEGPTGPEMAGYRGDIAISVETARQQAETAGHSLLAELRLLTVHGVLHLLGYDHDEPAAQAEMWAAQNAILHSLAA